MEHKRLVRLYGGDKMKRYPICGGTEFIVTIHLTEECLVDEYEQFIEIFHGGYTEITHAADDEDIWQCNECGYDDVGRKFNVKE